MQKMIGTLEKFLPEAVDIFKARYLLLQEIMQNGPIGRRGLAGLLGSSERMIRSEVEVLSAAGFVDISPKGIMITQEGEEILSILYPYLHMLEEVNRLEKDLEQLLNLKKAIIVKGNCETDEVVKGTLGFALSGVLDEVLVANNTIAITGGTTIAKMIEYLPKKVRPDSIRVIPARGSVGGRVEFQASTLAVQLADKLDADYELLAIPDNLSHESIHLIKNEPGIQNLLQKIAKTDMIIFGIGNAIKMAKRRKEPEEVLAVLEEKGAVAEVFRHYVDANGQVVYASESIGVAPEIAKNIPIRIAVAGGPSKANAILAARALLEGSYLILDEAAARQILHK